jgi:hypothetical protein
VKETTARQLAKSEKRKNSLITFVKELDNPATEHREASSNYFAVALVCIELWEVYINFI